VPVIAFVLDVLNQGRHPAIMPTLKTVLLVERLDICGLCNASVFCQWLGRLTAVVGASELVGCVLVCQFLLAVTVSSCALPSRALHSTLSQNQCRELRLTTAW
jgi:hypothetical protein